MNANHGHDECVNEYEGRRRLNVESRAHATRNKASWTDDEDQFLVREWIHVEAKVRDEFTIAACLERTIEACRVRANLLRDRLGLARHNPPKPDDTYKGVEDDDEDRWWEPDYYTNKEG